MNQFRAKTVPMKKKVVEKLDDTVHFPTLMASVNEYPLLSNNENLNVNVNALDYKKATEYKNDVNDLETDVDYIPDGWVKYTVNKKTKKIVETYGEPTNAMVKETFDQEEIFYELIDALKANWMRHRKSFVQCHGEEYYDDIFFTKNCFETDDEEEQ